jgi:hypothetical protein
MAEDICPYVYCVKCKRFNTWGRDETKDVYSGSGDAMWKGWVCQCGEVSLEPTAIVKREVGRK